MKNIYLVTCLLLFVTITKAQNPLEIPDTLSGQSISLSIFDTSKVIFPGFTTNTYGFNGSYLGPTIILKKSDSVNISVTNFIADTTTVHWHGFHVAPENDGGPHTFVVPGATWTPGFVVRDLAATYWYHPHMHMKTNKHISKGAAGMIIVRDSAEAALNLPRTYGTDDFPLIVQSRSFDINKQIVIGGVDDSTILVNGTLDPYLDVPEQVVRFRLLNASSERTYNFGLENNISFHLIATDGGLLGAPINLTRLRMGPGERAEILIDFSGMNSQSFHLINYGSELPNGIYGAANPSAMMGSLPGYSNNPLNGVDFNIIKFQVGVLPGATTSIPTSLVAPTPLSESTAVKTRALTFSPATMGGNNAVTGPFLINGQSFNMSVINDTVEKNSIEIWELNNNTAIAHPFHIHAIQFYILDIDGNAPPAYLTGRKDVVLIESMTTVRFIGKFENFCNLNVPYMYHCHMLHHEDQGMMGQFIISCPQETGLIDFQKSGNIRIYPNPATDNTFTIENSSTDDKIRKVVIYDLQGTKVSEHEYGRTSIGYFSLPASGIYLIYLERDSGTVVKKIVNSGN